MRDKLGSLVDLVTSLVDALEHAEIPYALGGAIAGSRANRVREPRLTVHLPVTN